MNEKSKIVKASAPRCPFCHEDVSAQCEKTGCESCMAWHHLECWTEHGACSACGFSRDPETRAAKVRARDRQRPIIVEPIPVSPSPGFRNNVCEQPYCQLPVNEQTSGFTAFLCRDHAREKLKDSRESGYIFNGFLVGTFLLIALAMGISEENMMAITLMGAGTGFLLILSSLYIRSIKAEEKALRTAGDEAHEIAEEISEG